MAGINGESVDLENTITDWVTVGRIRSAFGVRGWLKITSFTEPPDNILRYRGWQLESRGQVKDIVVDDTEVQQGQILVHIEGIDEREQAKQLANFFIRVRRSELPALEEDEYYWHELIGLAVYQVAGEKGAAPKVAGSSMDEPQYIGEVASMLETGANDVLVVSAGSAEETAQAAEEILIPYLPGDVVKSIDLEQRRILVDWYYD